MTTSHNPVPAGRGTSRWRWAYALFALTVLAAPALAMLFAADVNWGPEDFALMAAMLAGLALLLEGAARVGKSAGIRTLLMVGAVAAFLLLWAELAVGLFD